MDEMDKMDDVETLNPEDVIRIMVATDNHLGFGEKDPIRGDDSFITFEEILEKAAEENVDFILLGGDLFHDAVPSQNTLYKCTELLRRYVFGDKDINFEIISDETFDFHSSINNMANYEDPNLNISIPVFSIHGNHDDPSSFRGLSSLDILSAGGLVNYIGRWTDLNKVEVKPMLLQKGESKMAIYGLSHLHDDRLSRLFTSGKVQIDPPPVESSDWFNLMVLHQNRAMRGPKNYLEESILPNFMHLVIWGHEHDCRIEPEHVASQDYYISQPGSSVATSLAEGEAVKKHVAILQIHKIKFKMDPIPLQTVRPFVMESINLDDLEAEMDLIDADSVREMAEKRIEEMIEKAKKLITDHPKQPKLPLIRLRLLYTREDLMFNAIRFGQNYVDKVANPNDMVVFKKFIKRVKSEGIKSDMAELKNVEVNANERFEQLLERYFNEMEDIEKMKIMPTSLLQEIVHEVVERHDVTAVDNLMKNFESKILQNLLEKIPKPHEEDECLTEIKCSFSSDSVAELRRPSNLTIKSSISSITSSSALNGSSKKNAKKMVINDESDNEADEKDEAMDIDFEVESKNVKTSTRGKRQTSNTSSSTTGRGRGGARGGARGRSTRDTLKTAPATKRKMPPLDISITRRSSRQAGQTSILDSFVGASSTRNQPNSIYISDSDD